MPTLLHNNLIKKNLGQMWVMNFLKDNKLIRRNEMTGRVREMWSCLASNQIGLGLRKTGLLVQEQNVVIEIEWQQIQQ